MNYVDWSFENHPACSHRVGEETILAYCLPDVFRGVPDVLFRNRGGTFEKLDDVPGLSLARVSRGLASGDLDGDGDVDLTRN